LSLIRSKKTVSIKDISSMIRGVSEKTVQRELISLIEQRIVLKQGERRWSTYSLA
jgi:DeoR/GlpR family transcriptional regulator of sugar metabolism